MASSWFSTILGRARQFGFCVGLLWFCSSLLAQTAPDQALLGGVNANPSQGIDSGLYEVRPGPPVKRKKSTRKRQISSEPTPTPTPVPVRDQDDDESESATQKAEAIPAPSFSDQFKMLFSGKREPVLAYLGQLHPDDNRLNQLEVSFLPGYFNYQSKSSETYRTFSTAAPMAQFGATVWWTPFIGTYAHYAVSFGGDVMDSSTTNSHSAVSLEWLEVGMDFRQYFGISRRAPSLRYGFHYFEDKYMPAETDSYRTRTESSGVGLHFEARFPMIKYYSWLLGGFLDPRVSESENATQLGLVSGSGVQASRWGMNLGGEFKLSRESELVWNLRVAIEKDQYTGAANLPDPVSGVTPNGVSVTQTTTMFTFGYKWGH